MQAVAKTWRTVDEECGQGEGTCMGVDETVCVHQSLQMYFYTGQSTQQNGRWLLLWLTSSEFKMIIQMRTLWPTTGPFDTKFPHLPLFVL